MSKGITAQTPDFVEFGDSLREVALEIGDPILFTTIAF